MFFSSKKKQMSAFLTDNSIGTSKHNLLTNNTKTTLFSRSGRFILVMSVLILLLICGFAPNISIGSEKAFIAVDHRHNGSATYAVKQ